MTAGRLWEDNRDLARACLEHPFVRGIASGELDRERFAHYVGQDAFFLDAFARAYALALAKVEDSEGRGRLLELIQGVLEELRLHEGYAREWGVDLHPRASAATHAYTDFLLAVAGLERPGHILAAMAPCMRLYAYLGQELVDRTDPDSPYRRWVETYAAPEFEQLAGTLEELLDRYGGDPARLEELYRRAMQLELGFFEAAWRAGG